MSDIRVGYRSQRVVGKGYKETRTMNPGPPKLAVRFDEGTFNSIRLMALQRNVSFASVVRKLVEESLDRMQTKMQTNSQYKNQTTDE